MRNPGQYAGKKIAVLGLARSGLACANLLHEAGARVWVSECNDNESTRAAAGKLASPSIAVEIGRHTPEFITGKDLVVVSPGISDASIPVQLALHAGVPLASEIEVAWQLCPATVVAITGSTGKTTVTTLIARCFEAAGKRAFACGNIGTPFSSLVPAMKASDFVALEVSSFQLEKVRQFRPKVAVMLNLNKNHLDRHKDMQEYLEAKARIIMNQGPDDILVVNRNDEALAAVARNAVSRVVYFEGSREHNPNQAAALAAAGALGIPAAACEEAFRGFKGLEHRYEFVREVSGVRFINDSKATVAESTAWALRNTAGPVVLIAGGKDKGVDYRTILAEARGKVKQVVLIGQAAPLIDAALSPSMPTVRATTMEDAVRRAFAACAAGDTVILSPMCSSFDMFRDYEERGRVFKHIVSQLQ